MLTIYTSSEQTRRLQFVAEHLFNHILGIDFQLTNDKNFYLSQSKNQIWYTEEKPETGLHIVPAGLLSETGIHPIDDLKMAEFRNLFCFFYSGNGDIPFDLFSATFYLLSLYEEYLPSEPDEHGRFRHQNSLLFQNQVLEIPVIDRWAYFLMDELIRLGAENSDFALRKFRLLSTYDIDHPYLYRYKGFLKNGFGFLRDFLKRDYPKMKERFLCIVRKTQDPYFQAIEKILALQNKLQKKGFLFVLLGPKGRLGRSVIYRTVDYYCYLQTLKNATIGLHPSYDTLHHLNILEKEKVQLEKISGRNVNISRQHFLRMQTPETFRDLVASGFCEDFTLTFAHAPGFRSGTAVPHLFFDLQKNETLELLLHPTIIMDSTFIFHQKLSPEKVEKKIKILIDECKKSGGDFLSLWHNSNLAGSSDENPWINVFIRTTEYAISVENL
ncbi:MAG: polysaccharide deacetylase family protein [Candidatus Symbiothrix sp.]|jgi:hypothetical protein|nr:polysaccharide deacetylase family protein [Candidatus Symbiothrix sp.]